MSLCRDWDRPGHTLRSLLIGHGVQGELRERERRLPEATESRVMSGNTGPLVGASLSLIKDGERHYLVKYTK